MSEASDLERQRWQRRLLPLMSKMIIALAIFFFVVSVLQLGYLHWRIGLSTPARFEGTFESVEKAAGGSFDKALRLKQLEIATELEVSAMEQRYHQANALLMSRVWARYMGFVTGMILCLVGSTFILGKLQEPESSLEATHTGWGVTLRTTSPGVLLATLGTILMVSTVLVYHPIDVTDTPLYTRGWLQSPQTDSPSSEKPPPLVLPDSSHP